MRESWWTTAGARVFDVTAEGQTRLSGVDVFKAVGKGAAYDRTFRVPVTDGTLNVGFVNIKDGPGKEDKAYDFVNSWLRPDAAPALVEAIGYGHSNVEAMKAMDQQVLDDAGLGAITVPVLPQVVNAQLHQCTQHQKGHLLSVIAQKTMIAVTLCASVMATAPMAYAIRPMM